MVRGVCSQAVSIRGQLKHSWIENQILNKTSDDIVALHRSGWFALTEQFPERMKQAYALAAQVESGFSPAQLVDELAPLRQLPEWQRAAMSAAVHAAYRKRFDAETLSAGIRGAIDSLQGVLVIFRAEWDQTVAAVSESRLRQAWDEVLEKAALLAEALDRLPQGIVLP
jgi:hypothetical protein